MKAINILWDVDDDSELDTLPSEIYIPEDVVDVDMISEYVTDYTGFCHNGFDIIDD